ncbi:hypothetical protein OAE87_01455 [bacterium]|nr:hypothetical protein [bacterium]
MNLLWIGTPKPSLVENIKANHFIITHTFDIYSLNPYSSRLDPVNISKSNNFTYDLKDHELLDRLPYLIDIWSRWDIGSDLNWQALSHRSIQLVLFLSSAFSDLKFHKVVAGYATPHHLWNNLVELACELIQIPILHLYPFLELDISIPIFSNNHNIDSFPQSAFDQEWSNYTLSHIESYHERLKNIGFSSETQKSLQHRYRSPIFIGYYRYSRILKSLLATYLKRSIPYNALAFAGLKTNPFSILLALHKIQVTQDNAIRFYLRNISPALDFSHHDNSPTFLLIGHVQPEASTSPMGGSFYSQIKVAQYLRSKCKQCRILFKEHPGSFYSILPGGNETLVGVSRSIFYYKELLSLGVEFIPVEGNVISILKEFPDLIPVTITGSVALEAPISIGSPCIYFGEPYWHGYPGSLYYKDVDWQNINDQFKAIRSNPKFLSTNSIQWLSTRASLNCLPNIMGYGISSQEIPFSESLVELFYSRLNFHLSS